MNRESKLGGTFSLPGTPINLYRMGYGAMQLAGPGVWGLPPNIDEAVAVLRDAVAAGVNHIDTSDFYGPSVTNQLIKQVLHPYPDDLVIGCVALAGKSHAKVELLERDANRCILVRGCKPVFVLLASPPVLAVREGCSDRMAVRVRGRNCRVPVCSR